MRLSRLFKRPRWYVGIVGDDSDGTRVSKREALDAFVPLDCGTWDDRVFPTGPGLSGSIELGYFSYRHPFYSDKRIKYWKGYPSGVRTLYEG